MTSVRILDPTSRSLMVFRIFRTGCCVALVIVAACSGNPSASPSGASPTNAKASPTTASTSKEFQARVDIGGYDLWIDCVGEGDPTVILEAGLGDDSSSWAANPPSIARFTRVCEYDRAGMGGSDFRPFEAAVTIGTVAKELHTLLTRAGEQPPYVLVGHSYGGMIVRVFEGLYPKEVAGMVLVDSASESQLHGRFGRWDLKLGPWAEHGSTLDMRRSEAEILAAGRIGSRPLVVLSHGLLIAPPWAEKFWTQYQATLARLSSDAVHVIATSSHHYIHQDQPDLFLEAVHEVVSAVRNATTLPPCANAFPALGGSCVS